MMSYNAKKLLKQGLLTLPMVALLSGCGVDEKNVSSQSSDTITIGEEKVRVTGDAVKGVIQQGLVTAHRLVANKSGDYEIDRLAAKPVRTDTTGHYELRMRGQARGWAMVTLTADGNTRMTCDVVPQCDQPGGEPVPFGSTFALSDGFTLRGAGDLAEGIVYLTPLSQLAIGIAERSPDGLSPAALDAAYGDVERWFGLTAGTLKLTPPDLTRLDETADASTDAIQLAVINAAFLALVNEPRWDSITDVLQDMMDQVAVNGRLDILGNGDNLAMADIVDASAMQASQLQLTVDSSILSQRLAIVEHRNYQRFKTIADVYTEEGGDLAGTLPSEPKTGETTDGSTGGVADGSTGGTGGGTDIVQPPISSEEPAADLIAANAALLTWQAPFSRENGASLSMGEIAGYEIGYGLAADALTQTLAVGEASIDQMLINDLTEGNWFFAIRTLDTDGNRSRWSEVVTKTIDI